MRWMVAIMGILAALMVVARSGLADNPRNDEEETNGKTSRLQGTLYEKGTRQPLSGVAVFLYPTGRSAVTDEHGAFDFDDLPAGEYRLVVVAADYERFHLVKTLREGKPATVRGYLAAKRYKTHYATPKRIRNTDVLWIAHESKTSSL